MSLLFSQMETVHKLPLPIDMIRVIKSFIFDDRDVYKTKKIKNNIVEAIQNTPYSSYSIYLRMIAANQEHLLFRENCLVFWIEDDDNCPQFQSYFCEICGNYTTPFLYLPDKVICNCNFI